MYGLLSTVKSFVIFFTGYKLELENGHYGYVKVTYFNQTGYICMDGFDAADANVICKQIGYLGGWSSVKFKGDMSNTKLKFCKDILKFEIWIGFSLGF